MRLSQSVGEYDTLLDDVATYFNYVYERNAHAHIALRYHTKQTNVPAPSRLCLQEMHRIDVKRNLVRNDSNLLVSCNSAIEVVQGLQFGALVHENVALEPPWQSLGDLVPGVDPRGHGENVV